MLNRAIKLKFTSGWIGYNGIEKIVGSYFNVMGLPVKELYDELERF